MKHHDYRCPACNAKFDRYVRNSDDIVKCRCGTEAKRIISPVTCALDPISGDFPGATAKWIREHEQAGKRSSEMDYDG